MSRFNVNCSIIHRMLFFKFIHNQFIHWIHTNYYALKKNYEDTTFQKRITWWNNRSEMQQTMQSQRNKFPLTYYWKYVQRTRSHLRLLYYITNECTVLFVRQYMMCFMVTGTQWQFSQITSQSQRDTTNTLRDTLPACQTGVIVTSQFIYYLIAKLRARVRTLEECVCKDDARSTSTTATSTTSITPLNDYSRECERRKSFHKTANIWLYLRLLNVNIIFSSQCLVTLWLIYRIVVVGTLYSCIRMLDACCLSVGVLWRAFIKVLHIICVV